MAEQRRTGGSTLANPGGFRLPMRSDPQPSQSRPVHGTPSQPMPVVFEIVPMPLVNALAALWRELEARADATFFLSWDWIGCWIEETGLRPAILIGRDGGRVVLLGALVPSKRRVVAPFAIAGLHLHTTGDPQQDIITIEYN